MALGHHLTALWAPPWAPAWPTGSYFGGGTVSCLMNQGPPMPNHTVVCAISTCKKLSQQNPN
eukprot:6308451-Karenia_brevis.AAC.1